MYVFFNDILLTLFRQHPLLNISTLHTSSFLHNLLQVLKVRYRYDSWIYQMLLKINQSITFDKSSESRLGYIGVSAGVLLPIHRL